MAPFIPLVLATVPRGASPLSVVLAARLRCYGHYVTQYFARAARAKPALHVVVYSLAIPSPTPYFSPLPPSRILFEIFL